jgi:hypothetical protein
VTRPDTTRPDILASIGVADTLMPPSLVRPIAVWCRELANHP